MAKLALLLFLAAAAMAAEERDLGEPAGDHDPQQEMAFLRSKRWSGFSVFDALGGKGSSSETKPTKPTGGDGFNLADALHPDPNTSKPTGGKDSGFKLEDGLRPAVKATDKPTEGDCQSSVVQKLETIIENQNQQLRLLQQMLA